MELDELQVGDDRSGAQGQRHAIARRHRRVRGRREDLPHPTGREDHCAGGYRAHAVRCPLAEDVQGHPGGVAVRVQQQVEDERVFDHLDARIRP